MFAAEVIHYLYSGKSKAIGTSHFIGNVLGFLDSQEHMYDMQSVRVCHWGSTFMDLC